MRIALVGVVCGLCGCSLTFDGNFLDGRKLRIDSVSPETVLEGQANVVIFAEGRGIAPNAELTVSIEGYEGEIEYENDTTVAANNTGIARTIHLPVLEELAAGEPALPEVTVSQVVEGRIYEEKSEVTVTGLDELTMCITPAPEPDVAFCSDTVFDDSVPYSRIRLGEEGMPLFLIALGEVHMRATAEIEIFGSILSVSAIGCGGEGGLVGEPGEDGDGPGSGQGATVNSFNLIGRGGGGGGHASSGARGDPSGFVSAEVRGRGGAETGNLFAVPLSGEIAGCGGGGAGGAVTRPGGRGGDGGGRLFFEARRIRFPGSSGEVFAGGGNGAAVPTQNFGENLEGELIIACNSNAGPTDLNGGGGGGAGGTIIVRADEIASNANRFRASGGKGGIPRGTAYCRSGGDGAPGRMRLDSPVASGLADTAFDLRPIRGPVLGTRRRVFRSRGVTFAGEPGFDFPITIDGKDAGTARAFSGGGLVEVPLPVGRSNLCFWVPSLSDQEIDRTLPEAGDCTDVVYLPED